MRDGQWADPALGPQRGDRGMPRRGVIEDRVDGPLVALPGIELGRKPQAGGESLEDERQGAGLARRLEGPVHEVEMRIGALAAQLLEPSRARQDHVGEPPRRVVHEEVMADDQLRAR